MTISGNKEPYILCITSCINSAIFSNLSPSGFFDFVFDPEENKGGEFGVKASVLEDSMLVTFEVFYYEFEDLQVDFFNSQQFAYVTENAGGSETYGGELQAGWATPLEGLTVMGSLGYLKSKYASFPNLCKGGGRAPLYLLALFVDQCNQGVNIPNLVELSNPTLLAVSLTLRRFISINLATNSKAYRT